MAKEQHSLKVVFFRTELGNEPVRDWLLSLSKRDRKVIGTDVLKVQYCWPIGKPLVENLGKGLWEIRSRLENQIARTMFCVEGSTIVLLHGFIKKSPKTPKHELELAMQRLKQLRAAL